MSSIDDLTPREVALRIEAQKWREIADDLATTLKAVRNIDKGYPVTTEWLHVDDALTTYDEGVAEEED